jgi:hypothetical protein
LTPSLTGRNIGMYSNGMSGSHVSVVVTYTYDSDPNSNRTDSKFFIIVY